MMDMGRLHTARHRTVNQIRGRWTNSSKTTLLAGRRLLAQLLHDGNIFNPPNPTGPASSVVIASDGSQAAFVPARRALSWQLTDASGTPVVRERYWVTFQPGEIRVCTSCHGLNTQDQAGNLAPQNQPQALAALLQYWKTTLSSSFVYLPLVVR